MTMTEADQIAHLINERNQLARTYRGVEILESAANYDFEVREGRVVACVECKKVQWYQWEVRHLSVQCSCEGQGLAYLVYSRAQARSQAGGGCLLQCTIRSDNNESREFFARQGFREASSFYYRPTKNTVLIWQKALTLPPVKT